MKSIQRIMAAILALGFLVGTYSGVKASLGLAPATAGAVYYVSQTGSGTTCSSTSPCSLSTGLSKVQAGDTLTIQGTLTDAVTISKNGTSTARINITGGKIAASQSVAEALLVTGSFLNVSNLDVSGGLSFGLRVKGHDITLANVSVHDSVWENRIGSACRTDMTSGWGRGLTFAPSTYNIEVSGGSVYNNCGEGVSFTQNNSSYMHGTRIYDNFSRNVYIGNSTGTTIESITSYYSNPNFYRNGKPGRCLGLAIETTNYSTYGNMMRDATIRGNQFSDCQGINFYAEVANQYPTNVLVENNTFTRVASPQVDIPGTNIVIRNNTVTNDTAPAPTQTAAPTTAPTIPPTIAPTLAPTLAPSLAPTIAPTLAPTLAPPSAPTLAPTTAPTSAPTLAPTSVVNVAPTSQSTTVSGTTFDDKNPAFNYSSGWKNVNSDLAHSGSFHQTSKNGSQVIFQFTGSSFSVLYKGGPAFRKFDVFVDGVKVGTIDQQRTAISYSLRWDYRGTLTNTTHSLNLVFIATKSTQKGSVDAVIVR
jgi:hypothetical protein